MFSWTHTNVLKQWPVAPNTLTSKGPGRSIRRTRDKHVCAFHTPQHTFLGQETNMFASFTNRKTRFVLPRKLPKAAVLDCRRPAAACRASPSAPQARLPQARLLGWHYFSNATCLIRPHSFYACFVVSRITIIHQLIRHFWRTPALDK